MKAFSVVSDWGSSCIASPCWSADGKFAQVKLESAVKLGWEVVGARATNMGANGCLKLNIVAPPLNEKHSKLLLSRTAIVWRAFWYSFHSYFRLLSWIRVVFLLVFKSPTTIKGNRTTAIDAQQVGRVMWVPVSDVNMEGLTLVHSVIQTVFASLQLYKPCQTLGLISFCISSQWEGHWSWVNSKLELGKVDIRKPCFECVLRRMQRGNLQLASSICCKSFGSQVLSCVKAHLALIETHVTVFFSTWLLCFLEWSDHQL